MSWQAESRLRVASSSTGFIWISWRISETLMSGTIAEAPLAGERGAVG